MATDLAVESKKGTACRRDIRQLGWLDSNDPNLILLRKHTDNTPSVLGAKRIAGLYRALRKDYEDSKNEPGAADFYYGEMEMRRLASATAWGERVILTLYWLVSGYGLRGMR